MNFTIVDGLPKKRADMAPASAWKPIKHYFKEFMKLGVKYARVDFTALDYTNRKSAYVSLNEGVRRGGYPIKISMRGGDIYFVRTDMGD